MSRENPIQYEKPANQQNLDLKNRQEEIKKALWLLYQDLECAQNETTLSRQDIERENKAGRFDYTYNMIAHAFLDNFNDALLAAQVPIEAQLKQRREEQEKKFTLQEVEGIITKFVKTEKGPQYIRDAVNQAVTNKELPELAQLKKISKENYQQIMKRLRAKHDLHEL